VRSSTASQIPQTAAATTRGSDSDGILPDLQVCTLAVGAVGTALRGRESGHWIPQPALVTGGIQLFRRQGSQ